MPSLWGKEFLVFLNLVKYAVILTIGVVGVLWVMRRIQRYLGGHDDAKKP